MILDKRWALLHILIEKTQHKRIKWELSPDPLMFYCNLGGMGVAIRQAGNDFILLLFNENGDIVESTSDDSFASAGFPNAYQAMSALFDLTKAEATGSEKVVDALLGILKNT